MQINLIIDRLCSYYQVDKKKDLAVKLDVKPSVISNWITRNTLDWTIVFTKCENINYNWLLLGEGEMIRGTNSENPLFKDLFEKKEREIKELNREIGKLQATIEHLNKGSTNIYGLAAEPEVKLKRGQ